MNNKFKFFLATLTIFILIGCENEDNQNSTKIEPDVILSGSFDLTSNVQPNQITITNFDNNTSISNNNTYNLPKKGLIAATNQDIILFIYPIQQKIHIQQI